MFPARRTSKLQILPLGENKLNGQPEIDGTFRNGKIIPPNASVKAFHKISAEKATGPKPIAFGSCCVHFAFWS